jgi:hypothetical protein
MRHCGKGLEKCRAMSYSSKITIFQSKRELVILADWLLSRCHVLNAFKPFNINFVLKEIERKGGKGKLWRIVNKADL